MSMIINRLLNSDWKPFILIINRTETSCAKSENDLTTQQVSEEHEFVLFSFTFKND